MASRIVTQIIAGRQYGRLTALEEAGRKDGKILWRCFCSCGEEAWATACDIRRGTKKSCGCLKRERDRRWTRTHGMSKTPTYRSWQAMLARCTNPNNQDYADYGGRGIQVCDAWRSSFENFLADMGVKPSKAYTLDRVEVNGNYEKGNCRWITQAEQTMNTRRTRRLTHNGETRSLTEWARILGVCKNTMYNRLGRMTVAELFAAHDAAQIVSDAQGGALAAANLAATKKADPTP